MMFCLLQICRAARGRPTGGRTEPQVTRGFGFVFAASYDVLSTPNLSCSSGPTNGRPHRAASDERFWLCICRLSLVTGKSSERPGAVKGARFVRGEANP